MADIQNLTSVASEITLIFMGNVASTYRLIGSLSF